MMSLQQKFVVLFGKATETLRAYLDRSLPKDRPTWWQDFVVTALSFQQRRMIEQNRATTLAQLDFAGLLRVLDQNWQIISSKYNLSGSDRNFVKEMLSVRNRWAHVTTAGVPEDDAYRDLDTLQRFARVIQAQEALLDAIRQAKSEILPQMPHPKVTPPAPTAPQPSARTESAPSTLEFSVGQLVVPKSNPSQTGAVIAAIPGEPENRYTVFHNGTTTTYYATQLRAAQSVHSAPPSISLAQFHANLSALQICQPSLSHLYSLNTAKIDYVPYQYRPVLKFIRADRPRLLIADSVGVGKTIEAGLTYRELQARGNIQKVLIICPKPLVVERKWELEMKRFDERFTQLDGPKLRYCIDETHLDGEWPEEHSKTILPYSLLDGTLLHGDSDGRNRRRRGLLDLDPRPRFDLVVVDEAHRIRNVDTYTYEGVRFFCDNAEAVLFLTATPIQLGSDDLFVLLNALRPDLIIDRQSYDHMAAPNPHINRAIELVRAQPDGWGNDARLALLGAANTEWGRRFLQDNPEFQRVFDVLGAGTISPEDRVDIIRSLEQMRTFSGIINRTRRRDIGAFTIRRPETVEVPFTDPQKQVHDDILRIQATILGKLHGNRNIKFLMTTIRRQAASCLFGLVPLLEEILTRRLDELSLLETDDIPDGFLEDTVSSIESQIADLLERARTLPPEDPKLKALAAIISDKDRLKNNKVMVFSSFRHTLSYLHTQTERAGWRVGMVHGGTPDEERVRLRNRFRLPRENADSIDVLLFSEVGCEGLDYEFCDCMVNYDLPWNPMRVEQRIGRIDRRGQKSEYVSIYNMVTPGTVDADIYSRCLLRIGVFNQEIGASEEILGDITREIRSIAENLSLTAEEQAEKLQQLADNEIRLIREQQELEERQHEFFGLRLPERQVQGDIDRATSHWLSSAALQNLVDNYLRRRCETEQDYILGDKPLKTLRLSQDARDRMLADLRELPRQKSSMYRRWEDWLRGGDPHLAITFESACAVENPDAVLLTPLHPLLRQAAAFMHPKQPVLIKCSVADPSLPLGEHPFAVYQWQLHGLREDVDLRAVSTCSTVAERLMDILASGRVAAVPNGPKHSDSATEALESQHYAVWAEARQQHRDRVLQLADYRRESLKTSHAARMALLQEQLLRSTDDRIRRMRSSQITGLQADYERRIKELDFAISRADITASLVAHGVLAVDRPT